MSNDSGKLIQRYSAGERTSHWIIAICFVLMALSGLALFHPLFFWLANLFGGGPWTRILHPYVGVVMFVAFILFAGHMWSYNRMTDADRQWMKQVGDVVNNRADKLPAIGKYNAGQKLLFYVLALCMVCLLVSGVVMWRAYFSFYFPIEIIRLASVVHAISALVLICAIIVHVYAAIWVKGSLRAMIRGTVTPEWAWRHHREWFRAMRK